MSCHERHFLYNPQSSVAQNIDFAKAHALAGQGSRLGWVVARLVLGLTTVSLMLTAMAWHQAPRPALSCRGP